MLQYKKIRNFKASHTERALAQRILEVMQARKPDAAFFEIIGQPIPRIMKGKVPWTSELLMHVGALGYNPISRKMVLDALKLLAKIGYVTRKQEMHRYEYQEHDATYELTKEGKAPKYKYIDVKPQAA